MKRIAHAASSERTDDNRFGTAGDQTGREVRIDILGQDGNNWTRIFRCTDREVAERIGEASRQCAENPHIGYSMELNGYYGTRYGLWYAMNETGNISKITKDCNCDCSAMVACCVTIAGVPIDKGLYTAIEEQTLVKTGKFAAMPYDINKVMKGDILWREGHTAMCCDSDYTEAKAQAPQFSQVPKWVGEVYNCSLLNVRTGAGTNYPNHASYPMLGKGNLIDICDESGNWYYVRIAGKYFGWVSKAYIKQAGSSAPKEEPWKPLTGMTVMVSTDCLYPSSGSEKPVYLNGGKTVTFKAEVRQNLSGKRHPFYVYSKNYDGWTNEGKLHKA